MNIYHIYRIITEFAIVTRILLNNKKSNYSFNPQKINSEVVTLHTLGVFLSVFLLTRTGLSYFTRDAFGGIILIVYNPVQRNKTFGNLFDLLVTKEINVCTCVNVTLTGNGHLRDFR